MVAVAARAQANPALPEQRLLLTNVSWKEYVGRSAAIQNLEGLHRLALAA